MKGTLLDLFGWLGNLFVKELNMEEVLMQKIPMCDFCKTTLAKYDAPTAHNGSFAYMCENCAHIHSTKTRLELGKSLKQRTSAEPNLEGPIYQAIEKSSIEERLLGDRFVACPQCGEERFVEPDADYVYTCEGCGVRVRCTDPMFTV